GGMRQRVMIAMALSTGPKLLIADEPTTALDVTIQALILDLIRRLREETGAAVILTTHDLGGGAGMADRVVVMYAGRGFEAGAACSRRRRRGSCFAIRGIRTRGRSCARSPIFPAEETERAKSCSRFPVCLRCWRRSSRMNVLSRRGARRLRRGAAKKRRPSRG